MGDLDPGIAIRTDSEKQKEETEVYRALARHFAGVAEAYKKLHRLTQEKE